MVILLPLLICLVGVLMYALATSAKLVEIGRIMFAFGLLACLMGSGQMVNLLGR